MNDNVISLAAQITVGMILYGMLLLVAARRARAAGFNGVQAFLSLLWWVTVDVLMMTTSFFLARSAYLIWMPAESPLEELSPLLAGYFRGSRLEVADIFALAITLLVFGFAHAFAHRTKLVTQSIMETNSKNRPARPLLILYITEMLVLGGSLFYIIHEWETPVIALRIAQLLGSQKFDFDILSVGNVWSEVVQKSWLLRSISWVWALGIVFTAFGTFNSHLAFSEALRPQENGPNAEENGLDADEPNPHRRDNAVIPPGIETPQTVGETDTPQTTAAERVAEHARIRAADADARAARQAEVFATVPPAAPVSSPPGGTASAPDHFQAVIDQNAQLLDGRANDHREIAALRAQSAKNPLDLPNITPAAPAFFESTAREPAAIPRDEMEDGAPATPFSRNGTK